MAYNLLLDETLNRLIVLIILIVWLFAKAKSQLIAFWRATAYNTSLSRFLWWFRANVWLLMKVDSFVLVDIYDIKQPFGEEVLTI
jgi:hypothetical protein